MDKKEDAMKYWLGVREKGLAQSKITLGELEIAKIKMDGDLEEAFTNIVNVFEKQTKVSVKSVIVNVSNMTNAKNNIGHIVETKLNLDF